MEKWFWDKVRSMSLEDAQWLPDVEQVMNDMRNHVEWVKNIYDWAVTPTERFMILEIIDFGAPFFDGDAGEPDHFALHRWFGTIRVGDDRLQTQFLARAFECGNLMWSQYPLSTTWWDITEREVTEFGRYIEQRLDAGTGLDFDITPRSDDLPPAEVVLVWYAILEQRAEVLQLLESLLGPAHLERLLAKSGPTTGRPDRPIARSGHRPRARPRAAPGNTGSNRPRATPRKRPPR